MPWDGPRFSDNSATRPDFIICGGPDGKGGVCILASREMITADLDIHTLRPDLFRWTGEPIKNRVFLTSEMGDAVKIYAPTYQEAIQALAEHWDNKWSTERKGITPGQGELPAAPGIDSGDPTP